ncbi:hypothetical protein PPYR_07661 [Photinus pyralis]|uniref:Uncharacterized protein n=1 Tax=Photinus pyralis TaxID=7054 RepID=A0A5N4AR32_PHOPY|nr:hypothetical protein PPYR_13204 [Photinus pyralis]KAB0799781.1 hypothetical protein PPYR_07661 [Photinus pyralis]
MGSSCITIREAETNELKLDVNRGDVTHIRGFGQGHVATTGSTRFVLRVDEVEADVKALVVPNHVLEIPLLIGQPFTEQPHVLMVKDNSNLTFLKRIDLNAPKEGFGLSARKIPLWATRAVVIPQDHLGHIPVRANGGYSGDLYVEASLRLEQGRECCIPRTVLRIRGKEDALLPVFNLSDQALSVTVGHPLVRAWPCAKEEPSNDMVLRVENTSLPMLTMKDVQMGPMRMEEKESLLALLNSYRDRFSAGLGDLGCAKSGELSITLKEEKPFTYRPYRMSESEKSTTRAILDDLITHCEMADCTELR